MQDLRLVGVHDDGEHLVLTDSEGTQFRLAIDADLRHAVGEEDGSARSPFAASRIQTRHDDPTVVLRPRDVQALLRAGGSTADVAERAGWTEEKVERYARPIQAERNHVATLARRLPLRSRNAAGDDTFDDRVSARLVARGVEVEQAEWDSWKGDSGRWMVVCRFPAGGRQRQATWLFDPTDHTISATDDEARWLGEDEQSPGPVPAAPARRRPADAPGYDVEAEGGLDGPPHVAIQQGGSGSPTSVTVPDTAAVQDAEGAHDPVDLVSAMRERAGRRRRGRRSSRAATTVAAEQHEVPDQAAPPEHLDVENASEPPLGSHPAPEDLDLQQEQPEPASSAPAGATAAPEDTAAAKEPPRDTASEPPDTEPADEPGHDPVTGTADLFADQDLARSEPPTDELPTQKDADAAAGKGRKGRKRPQLPERPSQARGARPSVPSWDDIMFGSRGPGA